MLHHEVESRASRFDRIPHVVEAVGARHLYAADEIGPDIGLAEYIHCIDHALHPVVPADPAVLAGIDPFEQFAIPHFHVGVMAIDAGGTVTFKRFFILALVCR